MTENQLHTLRRENERLQKLVTDYQRLQRVIEAVRSDLHVDDLIELITREAIALTEADQGSVLLLDPSGAGEARTLIRQGESAAHLDHFLNMMLAGWVSRQRTPLLTSDIPALLGAAPANPKYREIHSALSIPMVLHGEVIGALNLIRLQDKPAFEEAHLGLLSLLATIFAQLIHNAKLHEELFSETERLRREVQEKYDYHGIIGKSPQIRAVFSLLERVIPTDARALLEGESGTGKELVAKIIHYNGPRKTRPFVAVDCGALPANLLEGELFGYVKGAFTGAHKDKKGLFEAADGGTLFLDEIVNMPLEVQSKFLRALQEGEIRPLGSTQVKKVDVRIISAASNNLREHLEKGAFRQDLYYRLNVVAITLPPLRERQGDIPILANHFLKKMAARHGKQIKGFKPETMARLEAYSWPGNIRELENIMERLVILADEQTDYIPVELLPAEFRPGATPAFPFAEDPAEQTIRNRKDNYEKAMLEEALSRNRWNQSAAARELGISERTVRYKMQKFGIKRP